MTPQEHNQPSSQPKRAGTHEVPGILIWAVVAPSRTIIITIPSLTVPYPFGPFTGSSAGPAQLGLKVP